MSHLARRPEALLGVAGLLAFAAMAWAICSGALVGIDLALTLLADPAAGRIVDAHFYLLALLWSPELSVVYGVLLAAVLWRMGLGRATAAPLAFLVAVPLEIAMKIYVDVPDMPVRLKDWPPYPWVNPTFKGGEGGFPNGSAMRTAFVCGFVALLCWRRGGTWRLVAVAAVVVGVGSSAVRVLYGYHWFSMEIASEILGIAIALLATLPVTARLYRSASKPRLS